MVRPCVSGACRELQCVTSRTTVERRSDRELVVTRTFNGPARIVFDAWAKPEHLKRWWAPKSLGESLFSCEADVRTGAATATVLGNCRRRLAADQRGSHRGPRASHQEALHPPGPPPDPAGERMPPCGAVDAFLEPELECIAARQSAANGTRHGLEISEKAYVGPRVRGGVTFANPPRTARPSCCVKTDRLCRFLGRVATLALRPAQSGEILFVPCGPPRPPHMGLSQKPLDERN
jgi:hypothetical protein